MGLSLALLLQCAHSIAIGSQSVTHLHYCIICRCFPREWPLYIGTIIPFGIIYIFNTVMFIIILMNTLRHVHKATSKETKLRKLIKKTTIIFVLALMFGVGWVFGVLGSPVSGLPDLVSRPLQYAFIIVAGLQGLFIFLLHPCRSEEAREKWKKWFYYLTCRSHTYQERLNSSKKSHAQSNESSSYNSGKTFHKVNTSASRRPKSSIYSGATDFAQKYGYKQRGTNSSTGSARKGDSLATSEYCPSRLSSLPEVRKSLSNASSASSLPRKVPLGKPTRPNMRQMFVLSNNNELITFKDSSDSSSTVGIEYNFGESEMEPFSPDSIMFANEHAQLEESEDKFTWQTHEYNEELQTGEATIYYNFEDDDSSS